MKILKNGEPARKRARVAAATGGTKQATTSFASTQSAGAKPSTTPTALALDAMNPAVPLTSTLKSVKTTDPIHVAIYAPQRNVVRSSFFSYNKFV